MSIFRVKVLAAEILAYAGYYEYADDLEKISPGCKRACYNKYIKITKNQDYIIYKLFNRTHRIGGPAVIYNNGNKYYYQNHKLHRIDGPAIYNNGNKYYYQNHKLHRLDGPAVIEKNGYLSYYQNDKLHRNNGPALIFGNAGYEYYRHNRLHNLCGPAVNIYGYKYYYIFDNRLDEIFLYICKYILCILCMIALCKAGYSKLINLF